MYAIIDDDPAACDRLKWLLGNIGVGEPLLCFSDPRKALNKLEKCPADLIFLDIHMPEINGFELLTCLKNKNYKTEVICTTVHNNFLRDALHHRVIDYLMKPIMEDELKTALERFNKEAQKKVVDAYSFKNKGLSNRQIQIIQLIFEGKTSAEIGRCLFLSKHTIDTHRRNILRATGCKNTTELLNLI